MIDELANAYRDEEARLHKARLLAWSSVGGFDIVAGFQCEPLTARAWIDLQLAENAIVCGKEASDGDAAAYIWRNSSNYRAGDDWRTHRAREKVIKTLRKRIKGEALMAAYTHLNEAFEELPQSNSTGNGIDNSFPDVEGIVSAIDEVAARYGTNPERVIDWPLSRIFQLQKAGRIATIPDYKLRQPESLMLIRREFLKVKT